MSHCETKIGLSIDSEQKLVWLCKGNKLVNQARKWFYLGIDFLKIVLLKAYNFYDTSQYTIYFHTLSCSEIKMFQEGILGAKWYCQHAKVFEAAQIYLLA